MKKIFILSLILMFTQITYAQNEPAGDCTAFVKTLAKKIFSAQEPSASIYEIENVTKTGEKSASITGYYKVYYKTQLMGCSDTIVIVADKVDRYFSEIPSMCRLIYIRNTHERNSGRPDLDPYGMHGHRSCSSPI